MDEFDSSDSGSGFDTAGLIESLANNATSAYETTQALNANPLNTALIYGGTAQTTQGYAGSGSSLNAAPSIGMSGFLLLLLAGGVVFYAATR